MLGRSCSQFYLTTFWLIKLKWKPTGWRWLLHGFAECNLPEGSVQQGLGRIPGVEQPTRVVSGIFFFISLCVYVWAWYQGWTRSRITIHANHLRIMQITRFLAARDHGSRVELDFKKNHGSCSKSVMSSPDWYTVLILGLTLMTRELCKFIDWSFSMIKGAKNDWSFLNSYDWMWGSLHCNWWLGYLYFLIKSRWHCFDQSPLK